MSRQSALISLQAVVRVTWRTPDPKLNFPMISAGCSRSLIRRYYTNDAAFSSHSVVVGRDFNKCASTVEPSAIL